MKSQSRWSRIVDLVVRRNPHTVIESEDAIRFVLVTRGPQPVRVGIRVRRSMRLGHETVVIAADLGHVTRIDATTALAVNARFVHETLVVSAGVVHLRALLALDDDEAIARFDRVVSLLAIKAAELKWRWRAPRAERARSSAFAHFSD